jgi:excisionase family DNA binding protein
MGEKEMNDEVFLTVKEASIYLRLKPLALYRMIKAKRIPFRRAGRSIRFVKSEIEVWLRQNAL